MTTNTTITPEDLLAHSTWLRRLAARLVDPSSAEDLVQETWAAAVRAQPGRDRPLRPWLAQVLRNLARMRARGAARWRVRAEKERATTDVSLPSPEELLTFHEAQRLVAEEVARLDEPYRATVLLCYAEGLEPSEIARRQSVPAGTVRWRLKHGLDELRSRLDARYGNDRRAWTVALAHLAAREVVRGPAVAALAGARLFVFKAVAALLLIVAAGTITLRWSRRSSATIAKGSLGEPDETISGQSSARGRGPAPPTRRTPAPPRPGLPALAAAATPQEDGDRQRPDPAEALRRAAEPGDSPARGNPRAPVTIVMYSEFQCPFCAKVEGVLGELQALYPEEVRFVWKHLPLPFHESAGLAAEAALAAAEQGKFWQMHDALFAHQDRLDPASLEEHARTIGLDVGKFKAALESGKHRKRIEADVQLAKDAGINGTPAFLINGEKFMGAQPLPAFKQKVEEALARVRGEPPPKSAAAPVLAGQAAVPRGSIIPYWPPPKVNLPDALLGPRLAVPVATGNAPVRGNVRGPVEVVYFTALTCGDCRRAQKVLEGLLSTYGKHVRVVAKLVPVRTADTQSLAAEVGLAAHAAGKFWEFHDEVVREGRHNPADRAWLEEAAQRAGLDSDELRTAIDSHRYRPAALADVGFLAAANINDTAFMVNGRMAEGTTALVSLVEAALKRARVKVPPWPTAGEACNLDPTAPGYDPFRLLMNLTPRQLFAVEARQEDWAGPIEKELRPLIDKDLRAVAPKLAASAFDCKASLCRLSWRPGQGEARLVASAVRLLYLLPGVRGPYGVENETYLALRDSAGGVPLGQTAAAAIARFKGRRSTVLFNVRTGRTQLPRDLPVDRLPRE